MTGYPRRFKTGEWVRDSPVEEDIVETLIDMADIVEGVAGRAYVVMLSGSVFRDAADMIRMLRERES